MQSQPQIRINAGPTTAALALIATLVLGGLGGYAIAIVTKAPVAIPFTEQVIPRSEATQEDPATRSALEQVSKPTLDEGMLCTPDLRTCLKAGSPTAPTFDEGRMCTADFKFCREPQNSYD
jgi:hypothetical protein